LFNFAVQRSQFGQIGGVIWRLERGIMSLSIRLWSGVALAALTVTSAAGQTPSHKPQHQTLKPGPSAGVQAAQQGIHSGLALVGASGAVIALVVAATANNGGNNNNLPNSQSVPSTVP
jgi:hypothetical protein